MCVLSQTISASRVRFVRGGEVLSSIVNSNIFMDRILFERMVLDVIQDTV